MSKTYSTAFTYPLEEAKAAYRNGEYDTVWHYIEETLQHWPLQTPDTDDNPALEAHVQEVAATANNEAQQLLVIQMLCLSKLRATDNLLQHAYHWVGRRRAWHRLSRTATAGSTLEQLGRKLRNRPTKTAITETETFLGL